MTQDVVASIMAGAAPQSGEGKVKAVRFGAKRDGVYARLTDKAPKPGQFVLFTQGVGLQGNKVVLFTLCSNDADGSILKKALSVVESIQFEQRPASPSNVSPSQVPTLIAPALQTTTPIQTPQHWDIAAVLGLASGQHVFPKVFWQLPLIGRALLAMVLLALPAAGTVLFFNPSV